MQIQAAGDGSTAGLVELQGKLSSKEAEMEELRCVNVPCVCKNIFFVLIPLFPKELPGAQAVSSMRACVGSCHP